jgi:hypothetical protein
MVRRETVEEIRYNNNDPVTETEGLVLDRELQRYTDRQNRYANLTGVQCVFQI